MGGDESHTAGFFAGIYRLYKDSPAGREELF